MSDEQEWPEPAGDVREPWPVPGCRCRRCVSAPASPAAPPWGVSLGGVRLGAADGAVTVAADGGPPRVLAAGEGLAAGGVRLVGLPGPDGATVAVAGTQHDRLLWAPVTGDLPAPTLDALADAGLTAAHLGVGAPAADGGPAGLSLARTLAGLRRAGALAPGAAVRPTGFSHDLVPADLAPWTAAWGLTGTAAPPRRTLVLGAAASGKSAHAEALLLAEPAVDYLPTGPVPDGADADWAARVAAHRDRRPQAWRTVEGADVPAALRAAGPPLLLDSAGTWVADALGRCGGWDDAPGWRDRYEREVDAVVQAWRQAGRRVVAVAEETGWGVVPSTPAGGRFRDALGRLTRRLAADAERVVLVVAGRPLDLPGGIA